MYLSGLNVGKNLCVILEDKDDTEILLTILCSK